jgi:hypothetical protein
VPALVADAGPGFPSPLANFSQIRNDSVLKSVLNNPGAGRLETREMDNLVRYRAMESLCRQSAVFSPLESWRLLAEAEMWHHKAEDEIDSRFRECNGAAPSGAIAKQGSPPDPRYINRSLAG